MSSTREEQDSTAIHSSIALLQERFRKLQKVKEMREERELMRILSAEPKQHMKNLNNPSSAMHCEQSRSFFHSEFILPPPGSPPQVPLPILPPSQSKHSSYSAGCSDGAGTLLMNSWPIMDHMPSSAALTPSNKFKDSDSDTDVDTSLHL